MADRIAHDFAQPALLAQALTHRSAGAPHNERLEFLGDALVNLFAAEALYTRWPRADEGALTRARAELVRESALAPIGRALQLGERLTLGPGEMKSGGHRRDSILADAVEAVVAAIYLDAGFETCRAVVLPWFEAAMPIGRLRPVIRSEPGHACAAASDASRQDTRTMSHAAATGRMRVTAIR